MFALPNIKVYSPKDKELSSAPGRQKRSCWHRRAAGLCRALPGSGAALTDGSTARDGHRFVRAAGEEENQL